MLTTDSKWVEKTTYKILIEIMIKITNKTNEEQIFKIINENFSQLAPSYYSLVTHWFINAYKNFKGIDKYIILIYLINKDFIYYRKNGLMVDYDTFYKDKTLEIPKINISDIARDLLIPKENVRRKISELEEKGIIKRAGKKIFIERPGFIQAKANITLKDFSSLVSTFSEILKDKKITYRTFRYRSNFKFN